MTYVLQFIQQTERMIGSDVVRQELVLTPRTLAESEDAKLALFTLHEDFEGRLFG